MACEKNGSKRCRSHCTGRLDELVGEPAELPGELGEGGVGGVGPDLNDSP